MSFNATVLRVFIASPSDVAEERDEIERAIFHWNTRFAEDTKTVLLPSRWESGVSPTYKGSDTQEIINEQLVNNCDILVGVFWSKLGTPTKKHSSGTLEEINIFVENGKEVMLYFVNKDLPMDTDFEEFARVKQFKREYSEKGIYATYEKESIINHLYRKVAEYRKERKSDSNSIVPKQQSNTLEELITSNKLTQNELLLLKFTLDTGIRGYGVRWREEETVSRIKSWEAKSPFLEDELSSNYTEILTSLFERNILKEEEYTSYGNVRLYTMPLMIFDELRSLSKVANEKLLEAADPLYFFE
ncbi:DUF4062 domain-containing protein [Mesobacillus subterraneus]|uniref:DUF4062 domain-containing protein n=1 Tax=Mesobacillus subterraneus TaxID=285983 RepID=UPI00203D7D4D|nr:DUF4062 domain-containing protein [Mesobacillus subterraneus]MCM3572514.1 DUF4062 domain-containing protein [Mesobacillus subterraneus]